VPTKIRKIEEYLISTFQFSQILTVATFWFEKSCCKYSIFFEKTFLKLFRKKYYCRDDALKFYFIRRYSA
jgi:hypothetical protein